MREVNWAKIERICRKALIGTAVLTAVLLGVFFASRREAPSGEPAGTESAASHELAQPKPQTPANQKLHEPVPELTFSNAAGASLSLSSLRGQVVALTFWASWCPHCQAGSAEAPAISQMLQKYGNVQYFLVDKLDGEKETREQALAYLNEHNISLPLLFDDNLAAYQALGMQVVPTTLVIDADGVLRSWLVGRSPTAGTLEAMLQYALEGGETATRAFVTQSLTDADGGVHTTFVRTDAPSPSGDDVLSESQGLLLEYALLDDDPALFARVWSFTQQCMRRDALTAWVYSPADGASRTNAVLDDLRLFRTLAGAQERWDGYGEALAEYEAALYRYATHKDRLIDHYDFRYRRRSKRLTLCYADFNALQQLSRYNPRWQPVYENALQTVTGGFIGEEFPLYYSYYDYDTNEYAHEPLHTAEALYTLLHLAQAGRLPDASLEWLRQGVYGKGLFARYNPDGTVVPAYEYESTAVYALAARIAAECGDGALARAALARMESMRVNDTASPVNGAFGNRDGSGIYSFDQLCSLLAYRVLVERDMV